MEPENDTYHGLGPVSDTGYIICLTMGGLDKRVKFKN
jgi:hypothetical protein